MSEENNITDFKMILPYTGNIDRVKAFENYTEKGTATITFIAGSRGTGKSLLANDMLCNDPIILDEAAQRYYMYPDLNPLNETNDDEIAIRMAREAYNFAVQGKDVVVIAEKANQSYEYLNNTLEELRTKKIYLRCKNKYQLGVDITLRLVKTEGIRTYYK